MTNMIPPPIHVPRPVPRLPPIGRLPPVHRIPRMPPIITRIPPVVHFGAGAALSAAVPVVGAAVLACAAAALWMSKSRRD